MLVEGIEGLERISPQDRGWRWTLSSWSQPSRLGRVADAEAGIARLEGLTRSHVDREDAGLPSLRGQVAMLREMRRQPSISFAAVWSVREPVGSVPRRRPSALGGALREDGRGPEAITVAREALEIYRTKGDVVSVGRVEAFLEGLTPKPGVACSGARATSSARVPASSSAGRSRSASEGAQIVSAATTA